MNATITCVAAGGGRKESDLSTLVTIGGRDRAREEANAWIKSLRLVQYAGVPMRQRFTYRGESLWWFTELYLHKMRRLDTAVAALVALDAARDAHDPARMIVETADPVIRETARAFGQSRSVPIDLIGDPTPVRRAGHQWDSYLVGLTATLSRLRPSAPKIRRPAARVAAFIHTAFWNLSTSIDGPAQERYIGPVLDAVQSRVSDGGLTCVGVGPRRNFRTRRWWDPLAGSGAGPLVTPIEQLAPRHALRDALDLWKRRQTLAREIVDGPGIRAAAFVRGCDLWPILQRELQEAADLQWPWSARAMDEAGAALDALTPAVVVTYAEAGGWGRALVLEARRRGVPSVGLQHGFVYRHWLNYLHEADEIEPAGSDRGFPMPTRTLLFDRYAVAELESAGHFPKDALRVTGSAKLDDLVTRFKAQDGEARAAVRREFGVTDEGRLLVLTAKFSEVQAELPSLFRAVGERLSLRLVVKPHPAETAAVYAPLAGKYPNVSIASVDTDLAKLLAAADGLVTMNSTVAIDGLVLGVPALVIGLPNNLSPFVEAGVMLGAADGEIGAALDALLYDYEARERMARRAAAFAAEYNMRADGKAAERAADEILAL